MTNLLTPNEAANYLRTESNDPTMLMLLPMLDQFVQRATGRDWTADAEIHPLAKAAAGMLLVQWYDTPSMMGSEAIMPYGLTAVLTQLEAQALKYRSYQVYGRNGAGAIALSGALVGDHVEQAVGVYGVSGDQSASFEATITVEGQVQQVSASDLSEALFVLVLKSPAEDVAA
jgi:hypothetical protein